MRPNFMQMRMPNSIPSPQQLPTMAQENWRSEVVLRSHCHASLNWRGLLEIFSRGCCSVVRWLTPCWCCLPNSEPELEPIQCTHAGSPAKMCYFAQPGHEPALPWMYDSPCTPGGYALPDMIKSFLKNQFFYYIFETSIFNATRCLTYVHQQKYLNTFGLIGIFHNTPIQHGSEFSFLLNLTQRWK